jgi:predicted DNA-binding transcriptional regulator AlpA
MTKRPRGKWLSVREQAEKTSLSESWIYHQKAAGTLPWRAQPLTKIKWVADSADIDDWLESVGIPPGLKLQKRRTSGSIVPRCGDIQHFRRPCMAVKTKNTGEAAELVTLKPIKIKRIEIKVVGDSSLIVHKWSQKAITMILNKQMKKASGGREARDPELEFVNTLYFIKGEPEELTPETFEESIKNGAQFGFPSTAFKQCAISGGYRAGMTRDKVSISGHFHIDDEFVHIVGTPTMRTDMVRLGGMGNPADIRFRAEFKE